MFSTKFAQRDKEEEEEGEEAAEKTAPRPKRYMAKEVSSTHTLHTLARHL